MTRGRFLKSLKEVVPEVTGFRSQKAVHMRGCSLEGHCGEWFTEGCSQKEVATAVGWFRVLHLRGSLKEGWFLEVTGGGGCHRGGGSVSFT